MTIETRHQAGGHPRRRTATLWTVQGLLAALFLFAGGAKLAMPATALARASGLPAAFMRFIAVCEILGALGLVLPGLLRIRRGLTPLAAAGLAVIMIGAVTVTLLQGQGATAIVPAVVGVLAVSVARGRRSWWRRLRGGGGAPLRPHHATAS